MRTRPFRITSALSAAVAMLVAFTGAAPSASAAEGSVELGDAGSFAVLAYSTVTNTGLSVIGGDVGVSPGTAVTGFPPGVVVGGTIYAATAEAAAAQAALGTAFDDASGRGPGAAVTELGGLTLVGGVYTGDALGLTGTLTLDAEGVPGTVWVFQAASTLTTASASRVVLQNGADPCNVFWEVGSSATLGTETQLVGTVMAQASITATTGADVEGRLLARTGAVTLDTNRITLPACTTTTTTAAPVEEPTSTTAPADPTTTTLVDQPTTTTVPDATTTTVPAPVATTIAVEDTTTTSAVEDTTTTSAVAPGPTTPSSATTLAPEVPATATTASAPAASTTTSTDGPAPVVTAPTDDTAPATDATVAPDIERLAPVTPVGAAGPRRPRSPSALEAPTAPGTPAIAAPGTPERVVELPRTGSRLGMTAGVGVLSLLLGELMLRRSRRATPITP